MKGPTASFAVDECVLKTKLGFELSPNLYLNLDTSTARPHHQVLRHYFLTDGGEHSRLTCVIIHLIFIRRCCVCFMCVCSLATLIPPIVPGGAAKFTTYRAGIAKLLCKEPCREGVPLRLKMNITFVVARLIFEAKHWPSRTIIEQESWNYGLRYAPEG